MDVPDDGLLLAFEGVCADEEALEDRLVHQAALCIGRKIGRVAALDDRRRLIQGFLGILRFEVAALGPAAGFGALGLDALLLGLEGALGLSKIAGSMIASPRA